MQEAVQKLLQGSEGWCKGPDHEKSGPRFNGTTYANPLFHLGKAPSLPLSNLVSWLSLSQSSVHPFSEDAPQLGPESQQRRQKVPCNKLASRASLYSLASSIDEGSLEVPEWLVEDAMRLLKDTTLSGPSAQVSCLSDCSEAITFLVMLC